MTSIRVSLLAAVLLAACTSTAEREYDIKQDIDRVKIVTTPTTPEAREAMRRAGQPVMTVKASPALVYRDFQQLEGAIVRSADTIVHEVPDVQGCVVVSYDVLPDGKTDGFEIEKSEPAGVFDKAALRTAYATEYEPAAGPRPRQQRAIWFIVARPPRGTISKLNDAIERQRNRTREEQRAACEGTGA
jgi:TonB family protein